MAFKNTVETVGDTVNTSNAYRWYLRDALYNSFFNFVENSGSFGFSKQPYHRMPLCFCT